MVDWIDYELFGLTGPLFADELVEREPLQCLETAAEVVGIDEGCEMISELIVVVVMEAFDRRCELNAIVGQHDLDAVGNSGYQRIKEGRAVTVLALSVSCVKANFDVPIPTYRYLLPSAVCTSAMSMWKKPIG